MLFAACAHYIRQRHKLWLLKSTGDCSFSNICGGKDYLLWMNTISLFPEDKTLQSLWLDRSLAPSTITKLPHVHLYTTNHWVWQHIPWHYDTIASKKTELYIFWSNCQKGIAMWLLGCSRRVLGQKDSNLNLKPGYVSGTFSASLWDSSNYT